MSTFKDKVAEDIGRLTEEGLRSALGFLTGFNLMAAAECVDYVKHAYPQEYQQDAASEVTRRAV